MTRYYIFRKLQAFINTHCKAEKTGEHRYNIFIQSGALSETHYDYGMGYYDVCIYYSLFDNQHACRIWFGTYDDGDYGSWTVCPTKEEAVALVEKAKDVFENMGACPNHVELNMMFADLGITFCNEC